MHSVDDSVLFQFILPYCNTNYMCTKINEEVLLGHTTLAITFIKNEIYDSGKYRIEIDCDNLDSSISIRLECLK